MGGDNYFDNRFGIYWKIYLFFTIVLFALDIIITLNTGYYEKGVVVKDRSKIAKHYIFNYLIIDFIGLIPLIFEVMQVEYFLKFWNWLIFIRIYTVYSIFSNF